MQRNGIKEILAEFPRERRSRSPLAAFREPIEKLHFAKVAKVLADSFRSAKPVAAQTTSPREYYSLTDCRTAGTAQGQGSLTEFEFEPNEPLRLKGLDPE